MSTPETRHPVSPAGLESALLRAEHYRRQLETVTNNATLALFIMDEHQQCTYMNPAAERLTGYLLEEVEGRALHDVIHHTRPDGSRYPLEECPIDQAFPQNMREQGHEVFVHKDGSFYPVAFTASPILDGERTVGTIIEVRDIWEEKEREATIRRQEERYRFLVETMPVQVWTARPDGRLDYVSRRTAEYFGIRTAQLLNQGWKDVIHPADLPEVARRWTHALATGDRYEVEFRLRRADGEYRWHLGRADAMRDPEGRIEGWFGLNADVEEERRAVEVRDRAFEVAELQRQHLSNVFQHAPAYIATVRGPDHIFELANPPYRQLVGGRELLGKAARDAVPELIEQGYIALLDRVYEAGEPYIATEARVLLQRAPDAALQEHFINFVYQPLPDVGGVASGVLAHGVDVTEQVRARREIDGARAEAEAANRAKSEFLAVMSHELRTPLNAIGGYAELIEMGIRGPVTEAQRADIARIQSSQRHLLGLINEVLNYAKLETGSVRYDITAVSVHRALKDAEALVDPQAHAKRLEIEVGGCPPDLAVHADAEKFRQILVNLLSNAVKFTDRGTIEMRCEVEGEHVLVRVCDTGIGIPPEKLEAIFEPFVQVRADLTRTAEGTGLGLAISRDLARGMAGELTAASTANKGSTFTLRLPRAPLEG